MSFFICLCYTGLFCALCESVQWKQQKCNYAVILIYLFCTLCLLPLHLISAVSSLRASVTDCLSISGWYLEHFESDSWNNNAKVISTKYLQNIEDLCSLKGVA